MEEKKFDFNQLIGYILIAGLITFMVYNNKGEETNPEEAETRRLQKLLQKPLNL